MPEKRLDVALGSKMVHLPQTKIFAENHRYHFHLPIDPFIG